MSNTKPTFNKKAYKHAISMVESAGGKYLKNGNALGRYQFIYRYIKDTPEMKGVSKRQFMNDRDLQEKIMDKALTGTLQGFTYGPDYAQKFIKQNNSNMSIEDATALVHFLGPGDAKKAIQNPDTFKVPGVNLTVDEYLSKFKTNYQRYQKHENWMNQNQNDDNPIQMAYDKNGMAILREDPNPNQPYVAPQQNQLPTQPEQNIQGDPVGFSPEGVAIANLPDQSVQPENMPNAGGIMRIENQNNQPSLQEGFLRLEDQMKVQGLELTGQKSDPQEDRYQQNRYMLGGMLEQLGEVGGNAETATSGAGAAEGGGPGIGAYVGAAGTALSLGKMAFSKPDVDTSGMTVPEEVPSKGSAALSGAMQGASAGMAFGPWGAAIGGVIGGAAGIVGNKKAKEAEGKAHRNYYSRIHDKATNAYEYGGLMESSDASPINGAAELVTMFENGGTHEQNSLGGIPQGMGANGKPNLVEEGETKFEDYIFSNNIRMDGTIIDQKDVEESKYKKGGMLKRADGSYSKRGLWDNIRANKGSGKKPTKAMLAQERKINRKEEGGELDPPTKENPPSNWDKLKNAARHYSKPTNMARAALLGPIGELGLNYIKGRVAENINPVGYGESFNTRAHPKDGIVKGPIGKVLNAIVEPQGGSAAWNENGSDAWLSERQDLLNMMMNDQLPSGRLSHDGKRGIGVSKYRPSNASEGTTYYDSPATEASIIRDLQKNNKLLDLFKANKNGVKTYTGYGVDDTQGAHGQGNVLGNYTMTMGKDDKGDYIDYYDKWDLQPWKHTNKTLTKITDAAQKMAGVVTPEIYGRVYMSELENNQKKYGGSLEDLTMMAPYKKKTLKDLVALTKKKKKTRKK